MNGNGSHRADSGKSVLSKTQVQRPPSNPSTKVQEPPRAATWSAALSPKLRPPSNRLCQPPSSPSHDSKFFIAASPSSPAARASSSNKLRSRPARAERAQAAQARDDLCAGPARESDGGTTEGGSDFRGTEGLGPPQMKHLSLSFSDDKTATGKAGKGAGKAAAGAGDAALRCCTAGPAPFARLPPPLPSMTMSFKLVAESRRLIVGGTTSFGVYSGTGLFAFQKFWRRRLVSLKRNSITWTNHPCSGAANRITFKRQKERTDQLLLI